MIYFCHFIDAGRHWYSKIVNYLVLNWQNHYNIHTKKCVPEFYAQLGIDMYLNISGTDFYIQFGFFSDSHAVTCFSKLQSSLAVTQVTLYEKKKCEIIFIM